MEKQNDKRVSRVSGCRETRDPAREQEPNNNYKASEVSGVALPAFHELERRGMLYLIIKEV